MSDVEQCLLISVGSSMSATCETKVRIGGSEATEATGEEGRVDRVS